MKYQDVIKAFEDHSPRVMDEHDKQCFAGVEGIGFIAEVDAKIDDYDVACIVIDVMPNGETVVQVFNSQNDDYVSFTNGRLQ